MKNLTSTILIASLLTIFSTQTFAKQGIITKQAEDAGFTSCLSTVKDLETHFLGDKNYGVHSVWATKDTNKQVFSVTAEVTYSDGSSYTSLTIAPTVDNHCSFIYESTMVLDSNCLALASGDFSKYKFISTLNKNISRFKHEEQELQLFMTPINGSLCQVTMREIGIRHQEQEK